MKRCEKTIKGILDCTKRGSNGATCAKTTVGNGDADSEDEELPPGCIASPKTVFLCGGYVALLMGKVRKAGKGR